MKACHVSPNTLLNQAENKSKSTRRTTQTWRNSEFYPSSQPCGLRAKMYTWKVVPRESAKFRDVWHIPFTKITYLSSWAYFHSKSRYLDNAERDLPEECNPTRRRTWLRNCTEILLVLCVGHLSVLQGLRTPPLSWKDEQNREEKIGLQSRCILPFWENLVHEIRSQALISWWLAKLRVLCALWTWGHSLTFPIFSSGIWQSYRCFLFRCCWEGETWWY